MVTPAMGRCAVPTLSPESVAGMHARLKFVEASKAAQSKGKTKKSIVSKADVALSHINKLYAIERQIKSLSGAERYRIRRAKSLP